MRHCEDSTSLAVGSPLQRQAVYVSASHSDGRNNPEDDGLLDRFDAEVPTARRERIETKFEE